MQAIDPIARGMAANGKYIRPEFIPYIAHWDAIPSTQTLIVEFPEVTALFPGNPVKRVVAKAWTRTFAPSKITDVWLDQNSNISYEVSEPDQYTGLPRYETKLHLCRIETGPNKVEGIFVRGNRYEITKEEQKRSYTVDYFKRAYIIPYPDRVWAAGEAAKGEIIATSRGDLWRVTGSGVLAGTEPNSLLDETEGTAGLLFAGRTGYSGVWQMAPNGGVMWYFSSIACGLLAEKVPAEARTYLLEMMRHCVREWVSGMAYSVGMKVAGANTNGRVWECRKAGVTTGTNPLIPDAQIGQEVTDGDVTWLCVGEYHGAAQWFWKDAYPTYRQARHEDSHDSYAACYIWAIRKYLDATNDTSLLYEATPHGGMLFKDALKEIIYYNLLTQTIENGLTKTFQNDDAPWGGQYVSRYLMDNCESWAGFDSAVVIFRDYAEDTAYVDYIVSWRDNNLDGLKELYNSAVGAFNYEVDADVTEVQGYISFYPWIMAQLWGSLWDVPFDTDMLDSAIAWANEHYPQWWARNDIDSHVSIGAHLGYAKYRQDVSTVLDILRRIETHHVTVSAPDMLISDVAYYFSLRSMVSMVAQDKTNDDKDKIETAQLLQSIRTGWILSDDEWTRLANNMVETSGDNTETYRKGNKLRIKQGASYKYFYIINVAYDTDEIKTIITVIGNYGAIISSSSPITELAYSRSGDPVGFPHWMEWEPMLIGWGSYPPGSYRFRIADGLVHIQLCQTDYGTSSAPLSGITLPAPSKYLPSTGIRWENSVPLAYANDNIVTGLIGRVGAGDINLHFFLNGPHWSVSGTKYISSFELTYEMN
jgi:hypothetical protein